MRHLVCLVVLVSLMLFTGCARKFQPVVEGTSFVYLHIDLTDEKTVPRFGYLKQISPKTSRPYYGMGVFRDSDNKYAATFFLANVSPGTYQVSEFGGDSRFMGQSTLREYEFPGTGENDTSVKVGKSGFYFLGSYKVVRTNSRWADYVNMGKFKIEKISSPPSDEVLEGLLPRLKFIRTGWEGQVKRKLGIEEKK